MEPIEDVEPILEELVLSLNPLGEEGGVFLFENILRLKKLRLLHADATQLANMSACAFATVFQQCTIKHVYLSNNNFEAASSRSYIFITAISFINH